MSSEHIIDIEKLVHCGYGLGRLESGQVALVSMVIPGERVRIREREKKKRLIFAEPLEIISASPWRIQADCSHYGICGGCDLQHIGYEKQLRLKVGVLRETLSRAKVACHDDLWLEPVAASRECEYGYRQRIRLKVSETGELGFFKRGSNEIVEIASCPVARTEINEALGQIQTNTFLAPLLKQSREVELIFSPVDQAVVVLFRFHRPVRPADRQSAEEAASALSGVQGVYMTHPESGILGPFGGLSGETGEKRVGFSLPEDLVGRKLLMRYEPGGFCQVNQEQNEKLLKLLMKLSKVGENDRVLDLYCGLGNFSIPLAVKARQVVGVDQDGSAIQSANRNMVAAGLVNCMFINKDAEAGARSLVRKKETFDLVLLDPPRQGCRKVVPLLSGLALERLIYISCEPATLARDLKEIIEQGFEIEKICPVDMFPQTHHLESLVLLKRKQEEARQKTAHC